MGASLLDGLVLCLLWLPVILLVVVDIVQPLVSDIFSEILWFAYTGVLNGQGGTWGKRLVGIRIVNAVGNVPGIKKGLIRTLPLGIGSLVLGLPLPLGVVTIMSIGLLLDPMWVVWDARKQSLSDKLAGTFVVRDRGAHPWPPRGWRRTFSPVWRDPPLPRPASAVSMPLALPPKRVGIG